MKTKQTTKPWQPIPLYYRKTDGGAEYLSDKFIAWKHDGKSGKEGSFEGANYVVRLDGKPTLTVRPNGNAVGKAKVTR